jgi:hypothetical protein
MPSFFWPSSIIGAKCRKETFVKKQVATLAAAGIHISVMVILYQKSRVGFRGQKE